MRERSSCRAGRMSKIWGCGRERSGGRDWLGWEVVEDVAEGWVKEICVSAIISTYEAMSLGMFDTLFRCFRCVLLSLWIV